VVILVFDKRDGAGSRNDGVVNKFSALRIFETDATRGLEGNVRWPRPVAELGEAGSPVAGTFALIESLVTLDVMRIDGVGLG